MSRPNENAREYAKRKNVCMWEVADEMKISEATLMRWLRFELPDDKKAAFIEAVDNIAAKKGGGHIAES